MTLYALVSDKWVSPGRMSLDADGFRIGYDKPDASNTGIPAGVTLTAYSGPYIITTPGTVIRHKILTSDLDVRAANVFIDECEMKSTGDGLIKATNSNCKNLIIRRSKIRPSSAGTVAIGIVGHDFISYRNDISGSVDGIRIHNTSDSEADSRVQILGTYIHNLCYTTPYGGHADNETHNDGVQIEGGRNCILRGNHISARGDTVLGNIASNPRSPYVLSCVIVTPNVGSVNGLTLVRNWFDGGYVPMNIAQASRGPITDITLKYNRFSGQKAASPGHDALIPETTKNVNDMDAWTGNIREDTGLPVVIGNG